MNPGDIHFHREPRPSVWMSALLLTVALHLLVILAVRITNPFAGHPLVPAGPDPIRMVFARPPAAETPSTFTELPPDRADERPDHPDFLSNVDSRARDEVPGGAADSPPRLEGTSGIPQVGMQPGGVAPPTRETASAEPDRSPSVPEAGSLPRQDPLAGLVQRRPTPAANDPFRPGSRGLYDLFHEEMFLLSGNAEHSGVVSMNTEAWAYAPWLMALERDFRRNWYVPTAYRMGLISGSNIVEIEVAPDGRMLRLEVIEEDGHPSLTTCSVSAFRATAPFRPLPASFPEESLILRIRLIYAPPPTQPRPARPAEEPPPR